MLKNLLAAALLAVVTVPAMAAVPTPTVAIVDVQKVLRDSTAAQSIGKQLNAQRETFQNEIKKDEDRLRAAEQSLVKSRETLTKEAFIEKQKALRKDFSGVERKVMARRKALDEGFANAMKEVRTALAEIVVTAAKENKANIVLPKQGTMWIAPELEITDTVLSRLNQKLPNVSVKVPSPKA